LLAARTHLLLLFLPAGNDKNIGVFFGAAGFPAAGDFAPQGFRPAQAAALLPRRPSATLVLEKN